jgi:DNA-binding protein HU-beta
MHKNELIKRVAAQAEVPHQTVARVLNEALRTITDEVGEGRRVVLTGFGTFELRQRSSRRGVDPRTGEEITVPATRTPGFTASATFKQRIQQPE